VQIQKEIDNKIKEGMLILYSPHTTGSLIVNEGFDEAVSCDIEKSLDFIVPEINFKHKEGNSDAHIKATLLSNSITLPIQDGCIYLGQFQRIFFFDFDGGRNRTIIMQVVKFK
jgi:secondary thiamine-phosphate synthase enzyme